MSLGKPQKVAIVAAVARNGAIGLDNRLLVHLPGDLPRFKRLTLGSAIVMGRKTWDSIGRPLPGRQNIVITRTATWHAAGAVRAASLSDALRLASADARIFVVGGGEIYRQALPLADELILTEIDADLPGDAFFPDWDRTRYGTVSNESHTTPDGLRYRYVTYRRIGADQHV